MDYEEFVEKFFDYNINEFNAPDETYVIVPFSLILKVVDNYRLDSFMRQAEIVIDKDSE
jgi:hypothetical protein